MLRTNSTAEHFRRIKQAADKPFAELKRGKLVGAELVNIREEKVNIDHVPLVVRRVFIKTGGSGALAEVGWVLNEGIPCCLSCHKDFSKLARKHHCRACGLLICSECTRMAKLNGFLAQGVERVCMSCVRNHNTDPTAQLANHSNWGEIVFNAPPKAPAEAEKVEIDMLTKAKKAASSAPPTLTLTPLPGFVIKVRRTTHDESKIFINVFHCIDIYDKFLLLTHIPEEPEPEDEPDTKQENEVSAVAKGAEQKQPTENDQPNIMRESTGLRSLSKCKNEHITAAPVPTKSGFSIFSRFTQPAQVPTHVLSDYSVYTQSRGEGSPDSATSATTGTTGTTQETENSAESAKNTEIRIHPIVYVGPANRTVDKEGHVSLLYSVLVSSKYFMDAAMASDAVPITHPTSINKIIQVVNDAHKESLCEFTFTLPRIKKGYMSAHNEELKSEVFTRSECSVACVPEDKITTTQNIRFGSISSEISTQSFVSTAEHYAPRNQGTTTAPGSVPNGGLNKSNSYSSFPKDRPIYLHSPSQMMLNDWYTPRPANFARATSAPNLSVINAKLAGSSNKDYSLDVKEEMLKFRHQNALTLAQSDELKARACSWPKILVGYQIVMPYTKEDSKTKLSIVDQSRVYVIIDSRKNAAFQTEYRVTNSANIANSVWTRLQRSAVKTGAEFRLICKVANNA